MKLDFPWAGEINRLQGEMERLFGNGAGQQLLRPRAYPPANLWEDDDNLYVETEVPGMELDGFELYVNDENQLTLQGERKPLGGDIKVRHREERSFGRFSRIIQLPVTVDGDATSANYQAGVLRITLPKKEESKPKRIDVAAG